MKDPTKLPMSALLLNYLYEHEASAFNSVSREGSDSWGYLVGVTDDERDLLRVRWMEANDWANKATAMYLNAETPTGTKQQREGAKITPDVVRAAMRHERDCLKQMLMKETTAWDSLTQERKKITLTKEDRKLAEDRWRRAHSYLCQMVYRYLPEPAPIVLSSE